MDRSRAFSVGVILRRLTPVGHAVFPLAAQYDAAQYEMDCRVKPAMTTEGPSLRAPGIGGNNLLKVGWDQVVGSLVTAPINFDCGRVNQLAVQIERAEKPCLIEPDIGLNSLQGILIDEKRSLHGAVVAPKPYGTPRAII
jgi:hypothetical protein